MTKLLRGQILFAFALTVLNTVYASQLLGMDRPFVNGKPGPSFLPFILCGFVYVVTFLIILKEFKAQQNIIAAAETSDNIPRIVILGPVIAVGLTALYILAFVYTGYMTATAGYTFLIAIYFNFERNGKCGASALSSAIIVLFITVAGWLFFVKLFGLYLPLWEF